MEEGIQEVVDHVMEEYPIKLTYKKLKWIITGLVVSAGIIYGAGIKTQAFLSGIAISDIKIEHQKEKAKLENEKLVIEKDKAAALADASFYRDRYIVNQKRLDACLNDKDFVSSLLPTEDDKEK